jgi:hypothetical protein
LSLRLLSAFSLTVVRWSTTRAKKGVGVYPLAKSTELRSDPQFSDKSKGATVSLAEPLIIQKTTGDWIHATTADMSKTAGFTGGP